MQFAGNTGWGEGGWRMRRGKTNRAPIWRFSRGFRLGCRQLSPWKGVNALGRRFPRGGIRAKIEGAKESEQRVLLLRGRIFESRAFWKRGVG